MYDTPLSACATMTLSVILSARVILNACMGESTCASAGTGGLVEILRYMRA
jgi:hypothetical protein